MTVPPLDVVNLAKVLEDIDTGDNDSFELVWLVGRDGMQPYLWPMRIERRVQGNVVHPVTGEVLAFSPRGDH